MKTREQDFSTVNLTPAGQDASLFEQIKNPQSNGNGRSVPGGDAMDKLPRWRRRQTLVNIEHQLKFTTVLLVQMTAVMLVIAAYARLESDRMMALVMRHLGDFPGTSHELHLNNQGFLLKVALAIGFTGMFQILFGIYASHKLAGPVHKMTGVIEQASRGDYAPRITFRSDDQLDSLAASLNSALGTLAAGQQRSRAEIEAIEAALDRVAAARGDAEAEIEELRRRLSALAGTEHRALETVGS